MVVTGELLTLCLKALEDSWTALEGTGGPWRPLKALRDFWNDLEGPGSAKTLLTRCTEWPFKKRWHCHIGGRGSTPVPFFSPNLPGPQKHRKWTFAHLKLDNQISYWSAYLPGKFSLYGSFWGLFPISGKKTWSKRKMLITLRNGFWYQLNFVHPFLPFISQGLP